MDLPDLIMSKMNCLGLFSGHVKAALSKSYFLFFPLILLPAATYYLLIWGNFQLDTIKTQTRKCAGRQTKLWQVAYHVIRPFIAMCIVPALSMTMIWLTNQPIGLVESFMQRMCRHTSGTILSSTIFMSARTSLSQFSHRISDAVVCLTACSRFKTMYQRLYG